MRSYQERSKQCILNAALSSAVLLLFTSAMIGQAVGPRTGNNPYSPSPNGRSSTPRPTPAAMPPREITVSVLPANRELVNTRGSVAQRTHTPSRPDTAPPLPPSEVYTVGVGDVLFIDLKNAPQGTGYFTVRSDGALDFPLAGENVKVAGRTVGQIEQILASGITLFDQPKVEVKVREYTSHKVTVSGLVDAPGERGLQRDAVPLYVISAGAGVTRLATRALVTHAKKTQTFDLRDRQTDGLLVYPGDSIEFTNESGMRDPNAAFYFIGGNVASAGQKPLVPGLTLYQALIASGGAKGDAKKAVIRRKAENGILAATEHNLKAIRDGRAVDPALVAGDVVEVRN